MKRYRVYGIPRGKPRMTRSDKWKKRKCVVNYWEWCDAIRDAMGINEKIHLMMPVEVSITFWLPIPKSRKDLKPMDWHCQKPDKDNLEKGLLDAIFENDEFVCSSAKVEKKWTISSEAGAVFTIKYIN